MGRREDIIAKIGQVQSTIASVQPYINERLRRVQIKKAVQEGAISAETGRKLLCNGPQDPEAMAEAIAVSQMQDMGSKLPFGLAPGNVGDLNSVIWPFYFTAGDGSVVGPGETLVSGITITQEACFIMMSIVKTVFTPDGDDYDYVNPEATNLQSRFTPGLTFTFQDSQSLRSFQNTPIAVDHMGWSKRPTVLPSPMMLLPNSNFEVQFTNSDADREYVPFYTFFGYRLRIDKAQDILDLVTG